MLERPEFKIGPCRKNSAGQFSEENQTAQSVKLPNISTHIRTSEHKKSHFHSRLVIITTVI